LPSACRPVPGSPFPVPCSRPPAVSRPILPQRSQGLTAVKKFKVQSSKFKAVPVPDSPACPPGLRAGSRFPPLRREALVALSGRLPEWQSLRPPGGPNHPKSGTAPTPPGPPTPPGETDWRCP
jgi:hypothetical protein